MTFLIRIISLLPLLVAVVVPAWGQDSKGIGVVTALTGRADLKRAQVLRTVPLKHRDPLFIRDVVNTHEQSLARVLLMGKSSVTVRELSRFEIREQRGPAPGRRVLIDLVVGRIRVGVARRLMKSGDEVQIRTPNVFAGVRGTEGIFEVTTLPDGTTRTVVTGISGEFAVKLPGARAFTAMAEVASDAGPRTQFAQVQVIPVRARERLLVDAAQVVKSVVSVAELQQQLRNFQVPVAATGLHPVGRPAPVGLAAAQTTRAGFQPIRAGIAKIARNPFPKLLTPRPPIDPFDAERKGGKGKRGKACKSKGKVPFC